MPSSAIQVLDARIKALSQAPGFEAAQSVVEAVIALLGIDAAGTWRLFNDSGRKLRDNSHWFMKAEEYADRLATYEVAKENDKNLGLKVYWTKKIEKSVIHWITALTPNFEDAPYLANENIGIDFVIPETADRVLVILSKEHVLRVIELKDRLTHTAHDIFGQWVQGIDFSNKAQVHAVLWKSFDFEPTNRTFYKQISSFFTEQKQYLLSNRPDLFSDYTAALFANRLIGRLIFCWFLDKKGVINREIGYFETSAHDATTHYRTKLEPLFFNVLNTPVEERAAGTDAVTPFLNGGLFEAKETDYREQDCLQFPADYFDRLFKDLNHYNFTTDESSSTYQQVAIDPEMLGRIFENLLAEQREETGEQARKAKGAFYTPREIVDFMCRESLREYLRTSIGEASGRDEQLSKLLDKMPHEFRDQQRNYRRDLQPFKHDLLKALEELTVLDPACGSGAFPMGMLQLLLETHERLESDFDPYKKKLTIIKNNIFGIDIEPMAVEIARLRAWLSIIVDEEGESDRVEPLPNLDFKFVCANTLVPLSEVKGLFDDLDDEKLIEIRDEYFRARKFSRKQELRDKYQKTLYGKKGTEGMFASEREKQLKSYHPFKTESVANFFDPRVIFGIEEGFGIVIGNPPYVQLQKMKISDELRAVYEKKYQTYEKRGDLYCLFYERAVELLASHGIISYVTSNSWMRTLYGKSLRHLLVEKADPFILVNIEDAQIFESATVEACIFFARKGLWKGGLKGVAITGKDDVRVSLARYLDQKGVDISKLDEAQGWLIGGLEVQDLKQKIESKGKYLKEWAISIFRGVTTGCNEAFIINKDTANALISEDSESKEVIQPTLRGRDVSKYRAVSPDLFLIFTRRGVNIDLYPTVKKYLLERRAILEPRPREHEGEWLGRKPGTYRWFEIQDNTAYFEEFHKPKIIWGELSNEPKFAYDEDGYYAEATLFIMTGEHLKYLLAVMNSHLGKWYFEQISTTSGMGTNRWKKYKIEMFPVAAPKPDQEQALVELVDKVIEVKKGNGDSTMLEQEIDQKVYELYGLTDQEKMLIEDPEKTNEWWERFKPSK